MGKNLILGLILVHLAQIYPLLQIFLVGFFSIRC